MAVQPWMSSGLFLHPLEVAVARRTPSVRTSAARRPLDGPLLLSSPSERGGRLRDSQWSVTTATNQRRENAEENLSVVVSPSSPFSCS